MRFAIALALTISLSAQDAKFEARSRVVLVPVSVTGEKGRTVDGLQSSDFQVFDNGELQKAIIDDVATGVAPIALAVAVQTAGISYAVLDKVRKIGGMIQPLITGEHGCAAVFSFAERVRLLQECTNEPDKIESAFRKLNTGIAKQAHMLDAVNAAVDHLRKESNGRRVLLLISESKDRGSESDLTSTVAAAQAAGVTVYALSYSAFKTAFTTKMESGLTGLQNDPNEDPQHQVYRTVDNSQPGPYDPGLKSPANSVDFAATIRELARLHKTDTTKVMTEGTGGMKLGFARQKGLEDAIETLGTELHTQYVISFTPRQGDAGYHRLEVRVNRPGAFEIRSRPGYWPEVNEVSSGVPQ